MESRLSTFWTIVLITFLTVTNANGQSPEELDQAIQQLSAHAQEGDPESQFQLGVLYLKGIGVTRDTKTSFEWFLKAADQGLSQAQSAIGSLYQQGVGVSQNNVEAARWWQLAAEQGDIAAQRGIGFLYLRGIGVSQDIIQAEKWYLLAGKNGNSMAQFELGLLYDRCQHQPSMMRKIFCSYLGKGSKASPEPSPVKAAKWYQLAAEAGLPNAQYAFGLMLARGEHINQDNIKAAMWLNLSFSQLPPGGDHDEAYKEFMLVKQRMNPEEISKARAMTHAWRPKYNQQPLH
ncbi:tetratricopeptide repeat protein [Amphritea sp. HPY]|uniref:tetratricopeptide repeat protein n=1 Tax=Amphritea sp. HPY TaxID=3421652 RepID=UPI003D7C7DAB